MSVQTTLPSNALHRGWASRFLRSFWGRDTAPVAPAGRSATTGPIPLDADSSLDIATRLIAEDRYLFVLLKDAEVDESEVSIAWRAIENQMALVPYGVMPLHSYSGATESVEVPAFYLDRYSVTNRQYQRFVRAGGYENLEIWPREVWPGLLRFTDRTGNPGPREWENGRYPAGLGEHPVVGVCWFEALAYARWVGKRLPTAIEWQKAGSWPEQLTGGACNRYPWGNSFDPSRANVWASNIGQTVPVREFEKGTTPNGIYQLTGNVWEWLDDPLDAIPCHHTEHLQSARPLRRITGGAFDTYFTNELTCHFITGQPELDRRVNIGFRCAVSLDRLRPIPGTGETSNP